MQQKQEQIKTYRTEHKGKGYLIEDHSEDGYYMVNDWKVLCNKFVNNKQRNFQLSCYCPPYIYSKGAIKNCKHCEMVRAVPNFRNNHPYIIDNIISRVMDRKNKEAKQ